MVAATKSADIGMERGRTLANLRQTRQLDIIAEGLPILIESADNLLAASKALDQHDRASTILRGHASEELAKVLILVDIVRCPPKLRSQRVGSMMTLFYDHLARLMAEVAIEPLALEPVPRRSTWRGLRYART